MKKSPFFIIVLSLFFLAACPQNRNDSTENKPANQNSNQTAASPQIAGAEKPPESADKLKDSGSPSGSRCMNVKVYNKKVDAKQTFPIDFAPFKGGCFVTTHDPENTNPPLGSEYAVYENGDEVYKFPEQFNGITTGCWVEGVSFQDLNDDNLTDIILVGKCSGKTESYNENMIYVNTGTSFTTDLDANYKLYEFTKIKDVADFAKKNRAIFFK